MLKRYQVLLPEWLGDYMTFYSQTHNLSFSEIVRVLLCVQLGQVIAQRFPDCKFEHDAKELDEIMKLYCLENDGDEKLQRFVSKIYFDARKSIEARMAKEENK